MRRSKLRGYGGVSAEDAILPPRAESVSKGLRPENDPMISDFYKPEEIAEMRRHREWTESLGGRRRTRTEAEKRTEKALERAAATERLRETSNVLVNGERSRRRRRPDPPHSAYEGTPEEEKASKAKEDVLFKGGRAAPLTEEEVIGVLPEEDFAGTPERAKTRPKSKKESPAKEVEATESEATETDALAPEETEVASKPKKQTRFKRAGLEPVSTEEASKEKGGRAVSANQEGVNPRARANG